MFRTPEPAFILDRSEKAVSHAVTLSMANKEQLNNMFAGLWWLEDVENDRNVFDIVDGIAIIEINGVLLPHISYGGSKWATGYNVLRFQLERAEQSPDVRGIALIMDSGGGLVTGLFELLDWMLSDIQKPIVAIANSICASATYAIASVTDSISCPLMGGIGSIGVIAVHIELSDYYREQGITPTVIKSGDWKGAGNIFEKLPEKVLADFQESSDEYRQLFAEVVATKRAAFGFNAQAALGTEAYFYERPSKIQEALSIGMIDLIANPDIAFSQFAMSVQPGA